MPPGAARSVGSRRSTRRSGCSSGATSRAQSLAERGKGDAAIRHDLEQQGLAADEIEPALASLEPERERAERVIARRGGGLATARLLAGRGFAEDAVEAAVAPEA